MQLVSGDPLEGLEVEDGRQALLRANQRNPHPEDAKQFYKLVRNKKSVQV